MKNILKFELSANGVFSALPYLALWLLGVASGYTSDWLRQRRVMSTTAVRKLFNTLGNAVPAVALIAVGYVGCDWVAAVALLTVATGFSGFTQSSFQVNSLDLSPAFASIVYGFSNTFANVPGIVSPYSVGLITAGSNGQTIENWRIIFYFWRGAAFYDDCVWDFRLGWGAGMELFWSPRAGGNTVVNAKITTTIRNLHSSRIHRHCVILQWIIRNWSVPGVGRFFSSEI